MTKRLIAGLVFFFLILSLTAPWTIGTHALSGSIFAAKKQPSQQLHPIATHVATIAHRGASAYAPEHTLASYRKAIQMKADYVELDLQMTKDGQLIAMHDETLERTTNAKEVYPDRSPWRVKDFTLAEIKQLDAGSWFNAAYPALAKKGYIGQKVPTLDEAIQIVKQDGKGKAGLYMETKAPIVYPGMEEKLIETLRKNNVLDDKKLFLESFSESSLRKIKKLAPNVKLIQLYSASMIKGKDLKQEFDRISTYASGIGPSKELVEPILIEAAHENQLFVHAWTGNSKDVLAALLALGVDGIFTNTPDQLTKLRELAH
ncbi:glycerophosphodiester phosphodiesterase [Neobacillus sp. SM06]|uniref:glycerophosphodiester phosphodiesterase n=1 Tax=Neobacillus sp. SM06 TaxID=3422492 RepID=UPI003D2DBE4F